MSSLLLYLILLLIYNQVQITQTNSSTPCNSSDGLWHGCSADLSALKLCINNLTIFADCSQNKPYCNEETKSCESKLENSNEPQIFNCPFINGFYPDPFDCKKYHQCYSGVSYEGFCNNNLVFNPKIPGCKKGICYTFSSVNGLCRNKAGKIVVHPQDKNVFVYCHAEPVMLRCPVDYIFDVKLVSCKYDCKTIGVFPDKEHYEWYYYCEKKALQLEASHWKCPDGYYFNPDFAGCIYYQI